MATKCAPQSELLKGLEYRRHVTGLERSGEYSPDTHEILDRVLRTAELGLTDRYPTANEIRAIAVQNYERLRTERARLFSQMTVLESILSDKSD